MGKDLISIVVPCYNAADGLDVCWNSIKRQTYGLNNLECIFVDDASTDGGDTLNKLHSFEKEAPENVIVVESSQNTGPGGAVNLGLEYATGKYLQIIGADDGLADNAIEKLYSIAEQYSTDIIQYNHTLILGEQRRVNVVSVGNKLMIVDSHDKRVELLNATLVTYGCTNKFYSMELIRKTGVQFAEHVVYEEPLFVYPQFLYVERIYFCEDGLYNYYLHPGSIVTSKIGKMLLDHPKVQLMVLEDCMRRQELFAEYKDVIMCYFLWSYYCETLFFTAENKGAVLPLEYFREMQVICRKLCPDWRDNPQIKRTNDSTKALLETINRDFKTQDELNAFVLDLQE